MKKLAYALVLVAGFMTMTAVPALAAKKPPAEPSLPPGGFTSAFCSTATSPSGIDEKLVSGKAVYSFKGKIKATVTIYDEGEFNAFGEPQQAIFYTPLKPRFDKVVTSIVCAPASDDGDGIPNSWDNCPFEPGPVGGDGCPLPPLDTDGDGVPDDYDDCPDVAGPNGGCPLPDFVFVSSGLVTLAQDGGAVEIYCPLGYSPAENTVLVQFGPEANWFYQAVGSTLNGIRLSNQGATEITGEVSMSCFPSV